MDKAPGGNTDKMEHDQRVGYITSGYITKKGTPSGDSAHFNEMPPGQNIFDQKVADLRNLPMVEPKTTGYGDGWD